MEDKKLRFGLGQENLNESKMDLNQTNPLGRMKCTLFSCEKELKVWLHFLLHDTG